MYRSTWIGLAATANHHHAHGGNPLYDLIAVGVLIVVTGVLIWTMRYRREVNCET